MGGGLGHNQGNVHTAGSVLFRKPTFQHLCQKWLCFIEWDFIIFVGNADQSSIVDKILIEEKTYLLDTVADAYITLRDELKKYKDFGLHIMLYSYGKY